MGDESIIQYSDVPHECMICNEIVYKWFSMRDKEWFWGNAFGRSTCGRSGNFHQVNDYVGDS